MRIDGKAIAQHILDNLTKKVTELRSDGVTPHLAVILVGDDESSKAYVRQKELKVQQIGAAITIHRFKKSFSEDELLTLIDTLNNDEIVHGVIVQRPLPPHIDEDKVTNSTLASKDIDGFRSDSPFDPPIALAVWRILKDVQQQEGEQGRTLSDWLQTKKIVILGKGQTAGHPIIKLFAKEKVPLTVIDSKTEDKDHLLTEADIVISAVGKPGIITSSMIKDGAILIGVGIFRGEDGKMHNDYDDDEVAGRTNYYTPVPGGVGPVNVAMLLTNLVKAAEAI
ncbi:MAG: bifunctional 5,10-methylenetetrahydrofolate dehydrogenase/5,10-methenyltetrahydrofolate cyclohydrolase [Patescibacteria group bacterium]